MKNMICCNSSPMRIIIDSNSSKMKERRRREKQKKNGFRRPSHKIVLFEMKFSLVQLNSVFVECCRNEYVEVNSIRNQWGKNPNQNRYTHTKYRELIETTPIHNCDSFGEKCLLNIFRYFFPIFFSILCFQVEFRNIK